MNWLNELREGRLTSSEVIELVGSLTSKVVRTKRYPPFEGHSSWTADALDELAADFLVERGMQSLTQLALRATDLEAFRRLLARSIQNFIVDQIRKTPRGKLIRRVREVLDVDEHFIRLPDGSYTRPQHTAGAWNGDLDALRSAAWSCSVRLVRWREDAEREGPFSDAASLRAVCGAVLDAAGSPVPAAVLLDVISERFDLGATPLCELTWDVADPGPVIPDEILREGDAAGRLWLELDDRQRALLPHLADSARQQATVLGIGKSQANAVANNLKENLRAVMMEQDQVSPEELMAELLEIQQRWRNGQMPADG